MPIPENFVWSFVRKCYNLPGKIIVRCVKPPKNSYYTIGGTYIFNNPASKK